MPKFQLLAQVPRVPERAPILRLAPPDVNHRTLVEAARCFRLSGDLSACRVEQDPRLMRYLEPPFEVMLYRASGGLRFHDTARWQVDDGTAAVTFDDEVSIKMARRFIKEFSVAALEECAVLKVTRLNVAVARRDSRNVEQRAIDVGVAFQRMVEGIPVSGLGGKVIVYIDHKGEPTGIDRLWRTTEDVYRSDVELHSPEYAQQEMIRFWGESGPGLITVDEIRFGYFEGGWDEPQQYLQPAYFLDLTMSSTEGLDAGEPIMRFEHFVPAAVDSPERLVPAPPAFRPQARRYEQPGTAL